VCDDDADTGRRRMAGPSVEIVEAGKSAWRGGLIHVCFFAIGAWAGASVILLGTRFKRWALRTVLTPIVLLCSGVVGLVAAWSRGAEFWLFLAIVLLSLTSLTVHVIRARSDRADYLATVAASRKRRRRPDERIGGKG